MTDVIYARYSSDNQREESTEGQLRECRAFAEKDNWCKTEQGINCVLGELARCGNQFVEDIKEYLL